MFSTMLGCVCALVDGTPIMSTSDLSPQTGLHGRELSESSGKLRNIDPNPLSSPPQRQTPQHPSVALKHILKSGKGLSAFCVSCILSLILISVHWHKT